MPDLRRTGQKLDYLSHLRTIFAFIKGILQIVLVLGTLGLTVIALLVMQEVAKIPDLGFLKNYKPIDSISIFDRDGKLIETIDQGLPRTVLTARDVPKTVKLAVLAAEDKRFYSHHGVSPEGIARAVLANLSKLKLAEGGSTISQQLAKNLFFVDRHRNGIIKLAEMVVAYQLEEKYGKDEILALYLTEIYFGNSTRGIEQAAHCYFGKKARDLTIGEAAYLAGIIRAPSYLGSKEHKENAVRRQHQVLDAMVEAGFISQAEALSAEAQPIDLKYLAPAISKKERPFSKFPYFTSLVLETVHKKFDNLDIGLNGLKIYTTLDSQAQQCAEQTLHQQIYRAPVGIDEEALVALSVKDGSVRALVGGARDYWQNQWNCAVNPHTAGSSLKPFIYLTAFMSGLSTPESMVQDSPFLLDEGNGKKWTPKNYDGKYLGNITIREALVQSRNMCTIYTLQQVGIAAAINTMRQAGIQSPIHPSLSLALGSPAVTPLELAASYGTLARGGLAIAPWYIAKVEDARGRLLDVNVSNSYRVFPEETTTWIVDLLNEVVRRGTGTQAKLGARPCAGKTGTADKAKDIWFVGFTPDMVTCVWGGGDEKGPRASSNVTGGSVMAQVFARFNQQYYSRVTVANGHLLSSSYYSQKTPVKESKPLSHSNDVPYWQIDSHQSGSSAAQPSSKVGRAPVRVIRQQKGITEYHWEE